MKKSKLKLKPIEVRIGDLSYKSYRVDRPNSVNNPPYHEVRGMGV